MRHLTQHPIRGRQRNARLTHAWRIRRGVRLAACLAAGALFAAACSSSDTSDDDGSSDSADDSVPTIIATTDLWADVVSNIACDGLADVESLMPPSADPHTYEPSLQDRGRMADADLVVANGLGFEASLEDTLEAVADGDTPVFYIGNHVEPITAGRDDHDEESDDHDDDSHDDEESDDHDDDSHDDEEGDDHDDDSHDDEEGDDHDDDSHDDDGHDDEADDDHAHAGGADPHIWLDPIRVRGVLRELAHEIEHATGADEAHVDVCLDSYTAALDEAHDSIVEIVAGLPEERRVLITNHVSLSYFAERYGFELAGSVIPVATSAGESSVAHLEELADVIEHAGVSAIFNEATHSSATIDALAAQIGGIEVVTLSLEGLGPAGSDASTYIELIVHNAELIVEALQPAS